VTRCAAVALTLLVVSAAALAPAAEAPASIPLSPAPSAVDPKTGERVALDPAKGPMHVVFMATWCRPCLSEFPKLFDLEDRWKADGYRLFLVAVSTRQTVDRLKEFQAQEPLPGHLLFDADGSAAAAFGASNIPMHVLVDRRGEIVARAGALDAEFKTAVERLIRQEGRSPRP
jgi:cytochrome c biogenesis protein CcmG, thiol:disulfide interchange protein DsbE